MPSPKVEMVEPLNPIMWPAMVSANLHEWYASDQQGGYLWGLAYDFDMMQPHKFGLLWASKSKEYAGGLRFRYSTTRFKAASTQPPPQKRRTPFSTSQWGRTATSWVRILTQRPDARRHV